MKKYILHLALMFVPFLSMSTTYYTLSSGNWTNGSSVWSTDGTTPCYCSPGTSVDGDTIIINHDINQNLSLTVSNNSLITVNMGASLSTVSFTTTINDSKLDAYGNISFKKLTIGTASFVNLHYNVTLYIETRLVVYGYLGMDHSYVYVNNGNILIHPTGYLDMQDGSNIFFEQGNFNNHGTTYVCSTCCIQVKGNFKNESDGITLGTGSIQSMVGNMQNDGNWGNGIFWCSYGTPQGMPTQEDCVGSNAVCAGNVLPVELASFTGSSKPGYNEVQWITLSEINCDYFVLERSLDGKSWETVTTVNGAGTTQEEHSYEIQDIVKSPKTYYYRLWQFDFDKAMRGSGVISVESMRLHSAVVFPNPTDGDFTLMLGELHPGTVMKIFDMRGNEIYKEENIDSEKVDIEAQLQSGVYQILIDRDGETESIKFVVK